MLKVLLTQYTIIARSLTLRNLGALNVSKTFRNVSKNSVKCKIQTPRVSGTCERGHRRSRYYETVKNSFSGNL